jgi:hypothetical protein
MGLPNGSSAGLKTPNGHIDGGLAGGNGVGSLRAEATAR